MALAHHPQGALRSPFFAVDDGRIPEVFTIALPFPPLVESWERRDHPAELRLTRYRDALRALAQPALDALEPPLALGLHVAGRPDVGSGCDLDNFLTPVVKALGGGNALSTVWATRGSPGEQAVLTIARPAAARPRLAGSVAVASTRLSLSPQRAAWKQALASAVGRHASASTTDPIELALRFGVSPRRNWVTLWKPAIDALGGILGEGSRPWHPRDDRISLLVLERELRPELGWDVELEVKWASSPPSAGA